MVAALCNVTKRDTYLQSFTRWQLCCHADSNCRSVAKGFLYSAQRKPRNGENNRILTLTLSLTLNLTLNDYFRGCAVCVAPFALRRIQIAAVYYKNVNEGAGFASEASEKIFSGKVIS